MSNLKDLFDGKEVQQNNKKSEKVTVPFENTVSVTVYWKNPCDQGWKQQATTVQKTPT